MKTLILITMIALSSCATTNEKPNYNGLEKSPCACVDIANKEIKV